MHHAEPEDSSGGQVVAAAKKTVVLVLLLNGLTPGSVLQDSCRGVVQHWWWAS